MQIVKSVILILVVMLCAEESIAQASSSQKDRKRSSIGAKKQGKLLNPDFDKGSYPHHSIGIKLGDPFALTYKLYGDRHFSFSLDIGRAGGGLYNRYFRERFDDYIQEDTFSTSTASIQYLTHKIKSDMVGEAKFLYNIDADKISPGLQLYLGGGWEWKNTSLSYKYLYQNSDAPDQSGEFKRNRLTMGPQIVAGIEYANFDMPISAFLELEYFTDVQADPGWHRFEGGVGLRYIF